MPLIYFIRVKYLMLLRSERCRANMRQVTCLLQLWVMMIIISCGMVIGKVVPDGVDNNITSAEQRFFNWTIALEKDFKNAVKSLTKSMLPQMMRLQEDPEIDSGCLKSLLKYAINLGKAKMWAVESKI